MTMMLPPCEYISSESIQTVDLVALPLAAFPLSSSTFRDHAESCSESSNASMVELTRCAILIHVAASWASSNLHVCIVSSLCLASQQSPIPNYISLRLRNSRKISTRPCDSSSSSREKMSPSALEKARCHDIRKWEAEGHRALTDGPKIQIFCGKQTLAAVLPYKMLASVSSLDIFQDTETPTYEFHLPENMAEQYVQRIVAWLWECCNTDEDIGKIKAPRTVWDDLNLLRAGPLLGMDNYVDHIRRYYWDRLRNQPISEQEARAVIDRAESPDDIYLLRMAEQIAENLRNGNVKNSDAIHEFVSRSWPLSRAVDAATAKLDAQDEQLPDIPLTEMPRQPIRITAPPKPETIAEKLARFKAFSEAKGAAERVAYKEEKRERVLEQLQSGELKYVTLTDSARKETASSQSVREKIKFGDKCVLTREEARYFEKTRGKRCPYKIKYREQHGYPEQMRLLQSWYSMRPIMADVLQGVLATSHSRRGK
jgi:hypothetical protein